MHQFWLSLTSHDSKNLPFAPLWLQQEQWTPPTFRYKTYQAAHVFSAANPDYRTKLLLIRHKKAMQKTQDSQRQSRSFWDRSNWELYEKLSPKQKYNRLRWCFVFVLEGKRVQPTLPKDVKLLLQSQVSNKLDRCCMRSKKTLSFVMLKDSSWRAFCTSWKKGVLIQRLWCKWEK